ncbi:hypothetical protein K443DRAFT_130195 [Laccaria amethystina LaAM-08-1]|uniref:Microbial-type PARG catalytic domain-containing protein n=1 Tax=Laccaria amethystina LaAM-08-1 TaxID=1095629 RepID=A0A0C9XVY1_9AGAR|nr:hypothetical protein K443DRAFT_130195 [Laccaria amethystina LaAM-08-1]
MGSMRSTPFCNQPARKPPKTGLQAEREKFYNQTPPPAAPTRKPLETGPQAQQAKLYDQAPYRSLTAKYPGASQPTDAPAWPPTWPPAECAQPPRPAEADQRRHPTEARPPSFISPPKAPVMSRESFTREWRQAMAKSTVKDINAGYIKVLSPAHQGTWRFDIASQLLAMCHGTEYCRPDSLRVDWKSSLPPIPPLFFGGTIIEGAPYVQRRVQSHEKIGFLNPASPTTPTGDFPDGGNTQEALLSRSSTLHASLNSSSSKAFYDHHSSGSPYYSNALIFSPRVVLFRNDEGNLEHPFEIDVVSSLVSSSPVNAEFVRSGAPSAAAALISTKIKERMRNKMGRILALFERRGVKHLVLGAFGVGACKSDIEVIAELRASLAKQFEKFRTVFHNKCQCNSRPARWRVILYLEI